MFAKHPDDRDIPALRQLWQEAFGDDDAFLDKFFATGYSENRCRVVMQEGQAAAALYWFDCQWEGKKLAYLYAVATAKTHRGQGLCRKLMAFAEEELAKAGIETTVLTPGEPSLFRFYENLGYRTGFFRKRTPFRGGEPISLTEYNRRREELLKMPHMVCTERFLQYAQSIYDLKFYKTPTGIAAAGPRFTAEVLPEDLSDAPYAMLKTAQSIPNAYLGFGLE